MFAKFFFVRALFFHAPSFNYYDLFLIEDFMGFFSRGWG